MDSTLNDISQLIRIKEKELHEIHDQRCIQLEQLVTDRDALLTDASKRFEMLKDDFQYNLALLEARDHEIERLEGHVQKITDELAFTDKERRSLNSQVEILLIKETERVEKHEENKLANKVRFYCARRYPSPHQYDKKSSCQIQRLCSKKTYLHQLHNSSCANHVTLFFLSQRILQELKDVIESMRWASAEETKLKTKEIEQYKHDILRMNAHREDSLEMQRRYSCVESQTVYISNIREFRCSP